jgi:hypothetical protein
MAKMVQLQVLALIGVSHYISPLAAHDNDPAVTRMSIAWETCREMEATRTIVPAQ